MEEEGKTHLLEAFGVLIDPRVRECLHPLDELLLVAICAITSGAEGWVAVAQWGRIKLAWLRGFLGFANGIASHDTFTRVFGLLDAEVCESCFIRWMQHLCPSLAGQVIPIDGKSVRRSQDGEKRMVHLVSAWHTTAGMILGQVRTADKSNEITAIPELLEALQIEGVTITIDAMGCQHAIVEEIVERKADYLIAVKENQPTLAQALQEWFAAVDAGTLSSLLAGCEHRQRAWPAGDTPLRRDRRCGMAQRHRTKLGGDTKSGDGGVNPGNGQWQEQGRTHDQASLLHQ